MLTTKLDVPTPKFGEALRAQVEERLNFFETGAPPSKNAEAISKVLKDLELEQDDGGDSDIDMNAPPKDALTTLEPSPSKKDKKKKKRKADDMDVDEEDEPAEKKVKLSKEEKKALKKEKKKVAKAAEVNVRFSPPLPCSFVHAFVFPRAMPTRRRRRRKRRRRKRRKRKQRSRSSWPSAIASYVCLLVHALSMFRMCFFCCV